MKKVTIEREEKNKIRLSKAKVTPENEGLLLVEKEAESYLLCAINIPYWNLDDTKDKLQFHLSGLTRIKKIVRETCRDMLVDLIKNKNLSDRSLTDFEFLALLGTKRNWRCDCPLCLEEKIGKVCESELTSVIVFRPCGHTFCAKPCFEKWLEMFTKTKTPQLNYPDIPCPICRTIAQSTFFAEMVDLSKNKNLVAKLTVKISETISQCDKRGREQDKKNIKNNARKGKKQKIDH